MVTEWAPPTIRDYSGVVFFASALIVAGLPRAAQGAARVAPVALARSVLRAGPPRLARGRVVGAGVPGRRWRVSCAEGRRRRASRFAVHERDPGDGDRRRSDHRDAVLARPRSAGAPVVPGPGAGVPGRCHRGCACRRVHGCSCRRRTRRGSSSRCRRCPSSSTRGSSSSRRRSGTSYLDVGGAREGWQATLDRWDVDAVVINPDQDGALTLAHPGRPGVAAGVR